MRSIKKTRGELFTFAAILLTLLSAAVTIACKAAVAKYNNYQARKVISQTHYDISVRNDTYDAWDVSIKGLYSNAVGAKGTLEVPYDIEERIGYGGVIRIEFTRNANTKEIKNGHSSKQIVSCSLAEFRENLRFTIRPDGTNYTCSYDAG